MNLTSMVRAVLFSVRKGSRTTVAQGRVRTELEAEGSRLGRPSSGEHTEPRLVFNRIGTFGRYLLTGGALFLIDLSVFLVLVRLGGFEPALAQPIGRATGAIAGFFGHRYITFFQNRGNARHGITVQGGGYLTVSIVMLLITPFVLLFFLHLSGGDLVAAKVLTEIFAVIAVYVSLRFVFAAKRA